MIYAVTPAEANRICCNIRSPELLISIRISTVRKVPGSPIRTADKSIPGMPHTLRPTPAATSTGSAPGVMFATTTSLVYSSLSISFFSYNHRNQCGSTAKSDASNLKHGKQQFFHIQIFITVLFLLPHLITFFSIHVNTSFVFMQFRIESSVKTQFH